VAEAHPSVVVLSGPNGAGKSTMASRLLVGSLRVSEYVDGDAFARDLPEADTRIMAATQKPINGKSFGETMPAAAWKTIPSWYIVSTEDRAINPDLERYYATRIGATTTEIKASHVAVLSHPTEVARLIDAAAEGLVP